jgi:hypothetical protein
VRPRAYWRGCVCVFGGGELIVYSDEHRLLLPFLEWSRFRATDTKGRCAQRAYNMFLAKNMLYVRLCTPALGVRGAASAGVFTPGEHMNTFNENRSECKGVKRGERSVVFTYSLSSRCPRRGCLSVSAINQTGQPGQGWPKVNFWEFATVDLLGMTSFTTVWEAPAKDL